MSEPNPTPKPTLKLRMGKSTASPTPTPTSATPQTSGPKLTLSLKLGGSKASTPVEASRPLQKASPQKLKKEQRSRKPSAKVLAAKRDFTDSEDDSMPLAKKLKKNPQKITFRRPTHTPTTPIRPPILKTKGKAPKRPNGVGYDSEASDREDDPAIEEQFAMRFDDKLISASGADCSDDCAYIHQMIEEKKIGAGADMSMKFFHPEGRRAAVTVRNNHYAATLVDMPTIIESMKSFDRKAWMKTADVSQMLLIFARIPREEVAKTIDLPSVIDRKTHEFPHGLTPPMRYARQRRFRNRTRRNDIEELEREVDDLFKLDAQAEDTVFEWFDPDAPSRDVSRAFTEDADAAAYGQLEDEDADAEGEVDDSVNAGEPYQQDGSMVDQYGDEYDIEDALENELGKDLEDMGTPGTEAANQIIELEGNTPVAAENESEEDSGDDDDEEEEDGEEEMDEEARARQAALVEQREDIAEMEKSLANLQQQHREMLNPILKKRIETNIENMRAELNLKKAAIEDVDEN